MSLPVASGSSRILAQLRQMAGPQQMVDVAHRRFGQQADRLRLDHQNLLAIEFFDAHALVGQFAIGRFVLAEGEEGSIG